MFCHLFSIWEGNTIDSLQRIIFGIPQKVRSRVLEDRKGFNTTRMREMRSSTEINQRPASIDRRGRTIWDLGLDELDLVLVVLEGCASEQ